MTKNKTNETNYGRILIGAIIIVGLVLIIFKSQQQPPTIPTTPLPTKQEIAPSGSMSLRKQNDRSIATVGETFDVVLLADSKKTPIEGYDAVVNFDPKVISYKATKNVDDRFEVIPTNRDGQIIVTGTSVKRGEAFTLKDSSLAILTFTANKLGDGKIHLELDLKPSKKDSNLIDPHGNDLLSRVQNGAVLVGTKVLLTSKEVSIDGIQLEIKRVEIPSEGCADCMTTVSLQVTKGVSSNRLDFVTGGIDGRPFESQGEYGMIYEIGDVSPSGVVVYFAPFKS